ncbi:MAG TPA: hypothetical protein VG897_07920 [Terriglobales bacterium]|nr:hypothetical protein [Terriglobales bacterium]
MRPIFLVVDPPDPESLSTRKLVLESAMFNVLTATSLNEGREIVKLIPVSAMIIHEQAFRDITPETVITELKAIRPDTPVLVLAVRPSPIVGATVVLSSHDPIELVRRLREMFNLPANPALVERAPRGR